MFNAIDKTEGITGFNNTTDVEQVYGGKWSLEDYTQGIEE
jgi:hypothetical protein